MMKAKQRGVVIERHFLLSKAQVVNEDGTWDAEVAKLLRRQAEYTTIRIIWIEEVSEFVKKAGGRVLLKIFGIFDGEEVSVSTEKETVMYRLPSDQVKYYIELFKEQRTYSQDFKKILPGLKVAPPQDARGDSVLG